MPLRELAERIVPDNITYEEIQNARCLNQTLHVRLFNNGIMVRNGLRGETRHVELLEQLFKLRESGYRLPDTEFKYYTMDTVTADDIGPANKESAIFSMFNDEKYDDLPRRILAPTPFFSGYWSGKFGDKSEKVLYQDEMNRIINFSQERTMPFEKKLNALMFKGTVYPYRKKLFDEIKDKISTTSEFLIAEKGRGEKGARVKEYQNPIEWCGTCRYQLVTDGAIRGGSEKIRSGTIRSMYMLATGSIVIYCSKEGHKKEWWQYAAEAEGLIQYCSSAEEVINIIRYFEDHPEEAHALSIRGIEFIKNFLSEENVLDFWKNLLDVYAERCDFEIREPAGQLMFWPDR